MQLSLYDRNVLPMIRSYEQGTHTKIRKFILPYIFYKIQLLRQVFPNIIIGISYEESGGVFKDDYWKSKYSLRGCEIFVDEDGVYEWIYAKFQQRNRYTRLNFVITDLMPISFQTYLKYEHVLIGESLIPDYNFRDFKDLSGTDILGFNDEFSYSYLCVNIHYDFTVYMTAEEWNVAHKRLDFRFEEE